MLHYFNGKFKGIFNIKRCALGELKEKIYINFLVLSCVFMCIEKYKNLNLKIF